ncbi:MAG: hypothetical protein HY658_13285, partial [Actinobacteria bacterium]|nr:hypothetical protein [Actinomycetota bacterium]
MSKKKTRERQLAKWQARRDAERRRKRRNRIIAGVVALAVGLGGTAFAAVLFLGGEEPDPNASPSPSATVSPTATVSPSPSPTPEPLPVACGGEIPEASSEEKRTFRKVPELTLDLDATYVATFETSCGTIEIELFPRQAPHTVNS